MGLYAERCPLCPLCGYIELQRSPFAKQKRPAGVADRPSFIQNKRGSRLFLTLAFAAAWIFHRGLGGG